MNIHRGSKNFQCSQCLETFYSSFQRLKHFESSHRSKSFACDICDKEYTTQYNLNVHMKTHSSAGNIYQCETCCSNFKQKSDLKKHQSIHSEETPFSCQKCAMSFKYKNSLRRHEKTHSQERNHHCDYCKKSFNQKCDLEKHIQTHERKSFECKECKKVFSRKDIMVRHYKTHLQPLTCPIGECRETFISRFNLFKHFRTQHSR